MSRTTRTALVSAVLACTGLFPVSDSIAKSIASPPPSTAPSSQPVEPKALSDQVDKGLVWLASQQLPDGGWNQGEASANSGREGEHIEQSNVADTAMAALALFRAGSTPKDGPHAEHVRKAALFVSEQVQKSSDDGLFVTTVKGTRLQSKLGQYIDTFAAALFLSEVRNVMPDDASATRVAVALDKVMAKIQKNQKEDGRWVDANDGWASALCQAVAHKAVNQAAASGAPVDAMVLARAERFANDRAITERAAVGGAAGMGGARSGSEVSGPVTAAAPASSKMAGSAGVELYARASNLDALQASEKTNQKMAKEVEEQLEYASTQA
ncbi:MAG: prenyltransferase/squalene oxidase repeat-containing protein, partial [Tepidisphaeraceae bacterium]